jgi:hypothetical protein
MIKEIIQEIIGNRNQHDKIIAKKKADARRKVKCSDNTSPHLIKTGETSFRYVCKPKDREKARKLSKAKKKQYKTTQGKIAIKKAQDTKKFRKG